MICKVCLKENKSNNLNALIRNSIICEDCFRAMNPQVKKFKITEKVTGIYIYDYNSKIREMLFLFKGTRDYEMGQCFLYNFKEYFRFLFYGFYMVPVPSFKDDDERRGFNHVEVMFSCLKLKTLKIIHKTKKIKQADLHANERAEVFKYLKIDDIDLSNKKILLVDDVHTTGSTIKACIKLLETKNPKLIKVLVMSRRILDK